MGAIVCWCPLHHSPRHRSSFRCRRLFCLRDCFCEFQTACLESARSPFPNVAEIISKSFRPQNVGNQLGACSATRGSRKNSFLSLLCAQNFPIRIRLSPTIRCLTQHPPTLFISHDVTSESDYFYRRNGEMGQASPGGEGMQDSRWTSCPLHNNSKVEQFNF